MIRVAVTGANGRMGNLVARTAVTQGLTLAAVVSRRAPEGSGSLPQHRDLASALTLPIDVVIDFTSAEASAEHARLCADRGVALVIGSTGFTEATQGAINEAARKIPILQSPNMSLSVQALFELTRGAAALLGAGFDAEVLELHHRKKKDAPSGTALQLAELLARGKATATTRFERHGILGERSKGEIGIQTLRGGDVVGEHTVFFLGDGERLELTHRATSRDQYAKGAIHAAKWLAGKPAGQYEMRDAIGLGKA